MRANSAPSHPLRESIVLVVHGPNISPGLRKSWRAAMTDAGPRAMYRTISLKPRGLSLQAAYRRTTNNLISDIVNCGRFGGICAV
jgi:hypothetical protein